MKATYSLLCFIFSLACVQTTLAQTIPDDLVNMLAEQKLSVATTPQAVLSGEANAALSQGVWQESDVLAFKRKFGYSPTVLPLTGLKQTEQGDVLDATNSSAIFYLVVNYPPQGDARNALAQTLQVFIDEDFQEQMPEKNYQSLPKLLKKMWKVKLGLAEPEFAYGYQ